MKTFYDIHMHVLNLSHPNLSSYLFQEGLIDRLIDGNINVLTRLGLVGAALFLPNRLLKKIVNRKLTSGHPSPKDVVGNCLSFFEIPTEYQLLVLEHFLKSGQPNNFNAQKHLEINGTTYDKILLCPLVIDFGYKNIENSVFYNLTPKRPVINQVSDLLHAIHIYYRFHLDVNEQQKKMKLLPMTSDYNARKHEKLFEIYPFMGIDTRNYHFTDIKRFLNNYFGNFSDTESGKARRERLFEKMGMLNGSMYRKNIDAADIFAGIKLYPQLGFDPYPDNARSLKKVQYLYRFCVERRIPIITHCSNSGFKVGDYNAFTHPEKWAKVLEQYPDLTLNFAHFGAESKSNQRQWRNHIIDLTRQYKNVYTDISCNNMTPEYYKELADLLQPKANKKINVANPELYKRVLYGSDFSINLLASKTNSYNEYLKCFADAGLPHANDLCEYNPERFLFGE